MAKRTNAIAAVAGAAGASQGGEAVELTEEVLAATERLSKRAADRAAAHARAKDAGNRTAEPDPGPQPPMSVYEADAGGAVARTPEQAAAPNRVAAEASTNAQSTNEAPYREPESREKSRVQEPNAAPSLRAHEGKVAAVEQPARIEGSAPPASKEQAEEASASKSMKPRVKRDVAKGAADDATPSLLDLAGMAAQGRASDRTANHVFQPEAFDSHQALAQSARRVTSLLEETAQARARDTIRHREARLPDREPEPHRRDLLLAAAKPNARPDIAASYRPTLAVMDLKIERIRDDIINNPMWINSAFLTREVQARPKELAHDKAALKEEPTLREALAQVHTAKAEHALDLKASRKAIKRLESFQRKPGWSRFVQNILADRENKLTRAAEDAAAKEHESQRAVRTATQQAQDAHSQFNAVRVETDRQRRAMALERRSEIEQPLREALLERYAAEKALLDRQEPLRMRDALLNEQLTLKAVKNFGGFVEVAEFRTASHQTVLVDLADHGQELGKLAIGDRVIVESNAHGARQLKVTQRGNDVWSHQDRVQGRVVDVQVEGDKLRGVHLEDTRTKERKWMRPVQGDDLQREFGRRDGVNVAVGDVLIADPRPTGRVLHLQREVHDRSRGR